MLKCVDRLLSINSPCEQPACTGIYNITDVAGFTWRRAANIAEGNGKDETGIEIARTIRRLSAKTAVADIMAEMYLKGWATNLTNGGHITGKFKDNALPGSAAKRGLQSKAQAKCAYTGMKLKDVSVKGATDLTTTLYIQVDNEVSSYEITLTANQIYTLENLCDSSGKNLFATDGSEITIWIEDANFKPYDVLPNCARCQSKRIVCGDSKGWSKTGTTVKENTQMAYGIIATISCECDYDKILCALPNDEYKAQIIKYQAAVQLGRMANQSDKFEYFNIYGTEDIEKYIAIANNGYKKRISEYVTSLRAYFQSNKFCGCVECYGSTIKSIV